MRALVVLAVLGVCSAAPFGKIPMGAEERAQFFKTFLAAEAAAPSQANTVLQQAHNPAPALHKWTGPLAATVPAGIDGKVIPVSYTNEVAAARSQFFNTYQAQVAATAVAAPETEAPVQPQPTPQAEAPVQPQLTSQPEAPVEPQPAPKPEAPVEPQPLPAPVRHKWTGPLAATLPAGVPGSPPQVPDTPEVVAAKQAFFSTYQKQIEATASASPTP
ncbi:cuticle protein CP1499-like [Panulirus ornatus]|uniref:cuticle protein CP1499-like n=1 Tax=Panulirus ornatus TaxID=150431 RepID=UPI003A85C972